MSAGEVLHVYLVGLPLALVACFVIYCLPFLIVSAVRHLWRTRA